MENKNEYLFNIEDNEYKLHINKENQYIFFKIEQSNNISLYNYQNKYELKQINDILNLNNKIDNFDEIRELFDKSYLNNKLSININDNNINIKIKFPILYKEYESIITLNKEEKNINNKFEIIINELSLLKEFKNKIINDKIQEIEKLINDLKDIVNKKMKENEESIKILKDKIKNNQNNLEINKKDIQLIKNGINNYKVKSKLCKIKITSSGEIGYGFLMKLYKGNNPFYCLLTNFINKNNVNENIEIYYDNQNKMFKINLNEKERFILNYSFINIDVTIIEILPKDNINENYFLLPNLDNKLENKSIYISQYEESNYIMNKIKSINQYDIIYLNNIAVTSGSPIFLEDSTKVIGINKKENIGNILIPIINSLKDNLEYQKINNGKYEGFTKNNKLEGYGKYIYENGEYYIGQWLNDLKHGKGTIYYKNNTIKYEGDYVKNKCEGYGKYIDENGDYYIGQFLNGLKHGKGTEYYKNNTIKCEGDFVEGKIVK